MKTLTDEFKAIYHYRYVVLAYVETSLKIRYRRSYLGFLWTLLAPLIHYAVIGVVFSVVLKSPIPNYFQYYLIGAFFFSLLNSSLARSLTFFISNEHFIKKVSVPKLIYVINGISYEVINFLLSSVVLLSLGVFFQKIELTLFSILSLIALITFIFFLFGIACILAIATVYFRDLIYIVPALLQITFFVTPVIYDKSMVPEKYHFLININPLFYFLDSFRTPLINQAKIEPNQYLICISLAFLSTTCGFYAIKKFEDRIVFKL